MSSKKRHFVDEIRDFSEETSIHGVVHIFQAGQSKVGIGVWTVVVVSMIWLGTYWSVQTYLDWQNSPVLTTVKTTAYPVKMVDFPAVTICGQGTNADVFTTAMIQSLLSYLSAKKGIQIEGYSSLDAEELIYSKESIGNVLKMSLHVKALFDLSNSFSKYPKNLENFTEFVVAGMSLNEKEKSNKTLFEFLLDPALKEEHNEAAKRPIDKFKSIYKRLNKTISVPVLLSALWYSTLPCFDIKGLTSKTSGEKAMLRYCTWKGVEMPCSAIFTTFPTDKGMRCSFNMKAAEEIFQSKSYVSMIQSLQQNDRNRSFTNSTPPDWYRASSEPKSQSGLNKGLYVVLDSHTDLLATGSADNDFQGFTGLIDNSGSYPLMQQNGFQIKAGHNNLIALSATKVDAAETLRSIDPVDRNCRFPDENQNLTIYKSYSQSNCYLECSLAYAQNRSKRCTPWYLPFTEGELTLCDPWEAVEIADLMFNDIPDNICSHCLPDCSTTIYRPVITTLPFKQCDESNLGISFFCNLDDQSLPEPRIWGQQVLDEYKNAKTRPDFISSVQSNQRFLARYPVTFTQMDRNYNAYEKDIAVLQVFFDTPSVFQYLSQPSQNWVSFFSAIGGLLGFCLGVSIVSFVEVVWLGFKFCATGFGN